MKAFHANCALKQYIILMFTNKRHTTVKTYLREMKELYGENDPSKKRLYGFGLIGPMLLTQSVEEMREEMNAAFAYAEEYSLPVYFQLDDVNNYTRHFGSGAELKYFEHPEMCEWICFPEEGERYGGEKKYGNLPRFWYNWGHWRCAEAFPNLASKDLQTFVVSQMKNGVLDPLTSWLDKLKKEGREYLFAGMSVGWETHIPDYSPDNPLLIVDREHLPYNQIAICTDEEWKAIVARQPTEPYSKADYYLSDREPQMQLWEAAPYGFSALHTLGYDEEKLKAEAAERVISYDDRRKEILYQVIHDYSELLSKTAWEAGIPREKIMTHITGNASYTGRENPFTPPIWCAVNDYSIPGFTMSPLTCRYDLTVLKEKIIGADPDQQYFAVAEGYAAGLNEEAEAAAYFEEMFGNGALVVTAFGYGDPPTQYFTFKRTKEFGYNIAVNKWLAGE